MSELDETAGALADVARALVRAAGREAFGDVGATAEEYLELERLRSEHQRVKELAEAWLNSGLRTYPGSDVKTEDQAARELLFAIGEGPEPDRISS